MNYSQWASYILTEAAGPTLCEILSEMQGTQWAKQATEVFNAICISGISILHPTYVDQKLFVNFEKLCGVQGQICLKLDITCIQVSYPYI